MFPCAIRPRSWTTTYCNRRCRLGGTVLKTSEMAKELEAVHQEVEDRDVQMAALTKALSEAGIGLRYEV